MNVIKKIALLVFLFAVPIVFAACEPSAPVTSPSRTAEAPQSSNNQNTIVLTPSDGKINGVASYDRNFLFVFDDSGSMDYTNCGGNKIRVETAPGKFAETRFEAAKWAAGKFIRESVPSGVNLGLYPLNSEKYRIPLGKDNRDQILDAIGSMKISGGTPLNTSLVEATKILVEKRSLQLDYGEYYIVVVSDGEATDDGGKDAKAGAEYAEKNHITIITIGFCLPEGHALSEHSWRYRNALNAEQLLLALKETQAELPEYDSK